MIMLMYVDFQQVITASHIYFVVISTPLEHKCKYLQIILDLQL